MSLEDLLGIADKFAPGGGPQVILNDEMQAFALSIIEAFELPFSPSLIYVDATAVRVEATADSPARAMLCGVPNILQPGTWLSGGLSDGGYRENTANVSMDFDVSANFWGNEKASQWYAIFAIAGDADTTFTLKAMPVCRVKSQATQTISLGTNATPATGIGYGWATDSLAGYILYFMSGASRGLMRVVSANNNDNGTGGTITYGGAALTVAAGDSFIIIPTTNFRLLGDIYNNASSNITITRSVGNCSSGVIESTFNGWLNPMWARKTYVNGCGGGSGGKNGDGTQGGAGGGSAKCAVKNDCGALPGTFYDLTIGAGGGIGLAGGTTSFGSLLSLPGGGAPASINIGGTSGGDGGQAGGDATSADPEGADGGSGIWGAGGINGKPSGTATSPSKYGGGGGGGGMSGSGTPGSQGFLEIETKI